MYNGVESALHHLEADDFSMFDALVVRAGTLLSDRYVEASVLADFIRSVYAQIDELAALQSTNKNLSKEEMHQSMMHEYDFDKSDTFIAKDDMCKRIKELYPDVSDNDVEAMLYVMIPDVFVHGWSDDEIKNEIGECYAQIMEESK